VTELITTERDLTNPDNLKQARFELDRALDETRLAMWAAKWGRAAVEAIENPHAEEEATDEIKRLKTGVKDAVREVKAAITDLENIQDELEQLT